MYKYNRYTMYKGDRPLAFIIKDERIYYTRLDSICDFEFKSYKNLDFGSKFLMMYKTYPIYQMSIQPKVELKNNKDGV